MNASLPWILSAEQTDRLLASGAPVRLADVRWYLDGRSGREAFTGGHLPGAVFVDLDTALAAPPSAAAGRHPLPDPEVFAAAMEAAGISDQTLVVAYDDASGGAASRLVWLLRATGHQAAVLDGGIQAWTALNGEAALSTDPGTTEPAPAGSFGRATVDPQWLVDLEEVREAAGSGQAVVIDSRAPQRYSGETEPMDARAGHVPGAVNAFHAQNVGPDGLFRSPQELRERFAGIGVREGSSPLVYCGSGVTACHNLVVLESLGIHGRLFPGSWSQYAGTEHPAATGASPWPSA